MPVPEQSELYIVRSKRSPYEYPNISVGEYLAGEIAKHDPNLNAFLDPGNQFSPTTYSEFHRQIQQFSCGLLELGLSKDDFVVYFSDNSLQYTIAWVASLYLGLSLCSVAPPMGPFEFAHQVRETKGTVLIFGSSKLAVIEKVLNNSQYRGCMDQFKLIVQLQCDVPDPILLSEQSLASGQVIHTFDQVALLGSEQQLASIPHFPVENPRQKTCAIFYTSGTTGKPKGVMHTHRSLVATLISMKYPSDYYAKRILVPFPLGHFSGSFLVLRGLDRGMTLLLFQNVPLDSVIETIAKYRVNHYVFSPNAAPGLAHAGYEKKYDLSCLEGLRYGASKIAPNLLEAIKDNYHAKMVEGFGATEFLGAVRLDDADAYENFKPGNLGNVQPNVEMKIVDLANGKALPAHENGEICFRGEQRFVGYLNNQEETDSTIDADGWYHSGDVGYYDERGCLYFTDRIKEVFKYKANEILISIFPAEIEADICGHSAVSAVCVVGVAHVDDGHWARAFVQLKEGQALTEQQLIDYLKENVASSKWLRAGVRFISEMPRTVVGKVDRQYFKKLVKDELITDRAPF